MRDCPYLSGPGFQCENVSVKTSSFTMTTHEDENVCLRLWHAACSYSVVSEVVFLRQLLDQRVNLEVVEDVDALHVAEAVVQDSRQLQRKTSKFLLADSQGAQRKPTVLHVKTLHIRHSAAKREDKHSSGCRGPAKHFANFVF